MGGPPMSKRLPHNLFFEVSDGFESPSGLPDFISGIGFMLVSHRLKRVLESFKVEVEFVAAQIQYESARRAGYFLANPLRVVRGVDLQASSIELDEVGIALSVTKLVLNDLCFDGIPIAFVHEIVMVAVQTEVADAISKAGCTGCRFTDPSTYRLH